MIVREKVENLPAHLLSDAHEAMWKNAQLYHVQFSGYRTFRTFADGDFHVPSSGYCSCAIRLH